MSTVGLSYMRAGNFTLRTFQVLCAIMVCKEYIGEIRLSFGPSMLPTFSAEPNLVLGECISPRMNPPNLRRGDVITFSKPTKHSVSVCKRILGLPGDTVCVDPAGLRPSEHVVVPEGHVWVQGDNSLHSLDSRSYGPVPIGLIRSKIIARLYPSPGIVRNNFHRLD